MSSASHLTPSASPLPDTHAFNLNSKRTLNSVMGRQFEWIHWRSDDKVGLVAPQLTCTARGIPFDRHSSSHAFPRVLEFEVLDVPLRDLVRSHSGKLGTSTDAFFSWQQCRASAI